MRKHDPEINGWKQSEFVAYLREVLIPDLERDDQISMAEDFKQAIVFISFAKKEIEENSVDSI
jgi:hypothetical protein